MDLNSLPDEMLTNVLKYSNYLNCKKLRTMNQRMDKLAKRAGLTRIPVEKFIIWCGHIILLVNTEEVIEGQIGHKSLEFTEIYETENLFRDVLTKWFTQLKFIASFEITFHKLDNELFSSLKENKPAFRNTTILNLELVKWILPKESTRMLIDLFPNLKTLNIDCHLDMGNVLNGEVLGNRFWEKLKIESQDDILSLDDDFLLNVVANTADFRVAPVQTAFTVPGVAKLLKECSKNSHFFGIWCYRYLANIELGRVPFMEVKHYLTATNIPGIEIDIQCIELPTIVYTVTLKQEKDTVVRFLIDMPE